MRSFYHPYTILATTFLSAILLASNFSNYAVGKSANEKAPAEKNAPTQQNISDTEMDPQAVLAKVDGQPIKLVDVINIINSIPPVQRQQMDRNQLISLALENLITDRSVLVAAEKEGLEKREDIRNTIAEAQKKAADMARNNVLVNTYITEKMKDKPSDAEIKAAYAEEAAKISKQQEVHLKHILVSSEATAKDAIKKLKAGQNFDNLAKKLSQDKSSAAKGGEIEWFRKDQSSIPEFAEAAFAMKAGTFSQKPIKSPFGWHVIQVLGFRKASPPALDVIKPELEQRIWREDLQKIVDTTRQQVNIERFNPSSEAAPKETGEKANPLTKN